MELRHLAYFVAVAEERNFTRAAERLNIAQPPLSQQIQRLEREVGGLLFHRTSRRVELTSTGEILLDHARNVLAAADRGLESARRAARGEQGEVTVGFSGTATYDLMPFVARAYMNRMPNVTLHLRGELLSQQQALGINAQDLDVGIVRAPTPTPELEMRILRTDPLMAVLPESHPLAGHRTLPLAALAPDRFISHPATPPSNMYLLVLSACEQAGFVPTIRHEVGETASLVSLVAAGLGVAVVPASVRHLRIPGAVYRPLDGCDVTADLSIMWREAERSAVVLTCVRLIRQLVGNLVIPYAGAPLFR